MPTPPYAAARASINGGGNQTGAIVASFSQTVQLSGENTSFWSTQRWTIYEYPDGFACPSGWTEAADGTYFSTSVSPQSFTLGGAAFWGKYLIELKVNNGDPGTSGLPPEQLVDKTLVIETLSPGLGLHGIAWGETNQFDARRKWAGQLHENMKLIDDAGGGGGGVTDHGALTGLADDDHTQYVLASGARALAGNWSAGGNKITNLGTPTVGGDAAPKSYVDGFFPVDLAASVTGKLPFANVADLAGLSVLGRSGNSTGVMAAITAASDGQVLRRSGSAIGFGAVDATNSAAIVPDFGAQNVLTTGTIRINQGTPSLILGTDTAGATRAAQTTGHIRGNRTFSVAARELADGGDANLLVWDGSTFRVGYTTFGGSVHSRADFANTIDLRVGTDSVLEIEGAEITLKKNRITWSAAAGAPLVRPDDSTGSGSTGAPLTVQGANNTGGSTSFGGLLTLAGGDGTNATGGVTGGATVVRGGDATGGSGTRNGGNLTLRSGSGATANGVLDLQTGAGTSRVKINDTGIGFFNATPAAQPTVTGSRGGNAALADLLTDLATLGLIMDGSSA
jgi:hypothetical protein